MNLQLLGNQKTNPKYILIVAVVAVIVGGGVLIWQRDVIKEINSLIKFPEIEKTQDETAGWEIYINERLGFEFKYPEFYSSIKEENNGVSLGEEARGGNITYLIISKDVSKFTDYKLYKSCSYFRNLSEDEYLPPCISEGEHWGQETDIAEVQLGGRKAKSFYLYLGMDNEYHIIQTYEEPEIEAKMYVAGGGLDPSFNQILSTFKFLPASPAGGDQNQTIDNSKYCLQDSDCELLLCSGCFNKEWLKTAPPDLPCMVYDGYNCQCVSNKCLEIK